MSSKETILAELTKMSDIIATARDGLTRNELIQIEDVEGKVRGMVDSIAELPPEDAIEMRPPLVALLENFQAFATEVQAKISEISTAPASQEADGDES